MTINVHQLANGLLSFHFVFYYRKPARLLCAMKIYCLFKSKLVTLVPPRPVAPSSTVVVSCLRVRCTTPTRAETGKIRYREMTPPISQRARSRLRRGRSGSAKASLGGADSVSADKYRESGKGGIGYPVALFAGVLVTALGCLPVAWASLGSSHSCIALTDNTVKVRDQSRTSECSSPLRECTLITSPIFR